MYRVEQEVVAINMVLTFIDIHIPLLIYHPNIVIVVIIYAYYQYMDDVFVSQTSVFGYPHHQYMDNHLISSSPALRNHHQWLSMTTAVSCISTA